MSNDKPNVDVKYGAVDLLPDEFEIVRVRNVTILSGKSLSEVKALEQKIATLETENRDLKAGVHSLECLVAVLEKDNDRLKTLLLGAF